MADMLSDGIIAQFPNDFTAHANITGAANRRTTELHRSVVLLLRISSRKPSLGHSPAAPAVTSGLHAPKVKNTPFSLQCWK
jgi:hypothetical protein